MVELIFQTLLIVMIAIGGVILAFQNILLITKGYVATTQNLKKSLQKDFYGINKKNINSLKWTIERQGRKMQDWIESLLYLINNKKKDIVIKALRS